VFVRPLTLLLTAAALAAPVAAQDRFDGPERIVALGDVHGDFAQFVAILRQAGLVDQKQRWIGGRAHLVQTGDVPDRGPDSRKVMDLLMALAPQAEKAGGRVHPLIGNHEAMNILGDLRYVAPGEYQAFTTSGSAGLRDRAYAVLADSTRQSDSAYRESWNAAHPLGWVEHRLAFEGKGKYGEWIRRNNAVVKIGRFLFLHGGISPAYRDIPIADLNRRIRTALEPGAAPAEVAIAEDSLGPLWYRGLATVDEAALAGHVDSVLAAFGVSHIVIGHTITPGAILPRHGGKVIMIDVGMSAAYGGPAAALIVEGTEVFALHRGHRLPLPLEGGVVDYLQRAAALDPPASRLRQYLETLEAAPR